MLKQSTQEKNNILIQKFDIQLPNLNVKFLLDAIQTILQECRKYISVHSSYLPLYSFSQQLNPTTLTYEIKRFQQLTLSTGSLYKFVRILQLLKILEHNLKNNLTITKRNLFYKLQQYYQNYSLIDKDIKLLCYNIHHIVQNQKKNTRDLQYFKLMNVNKIDLGVIASNRCIIFGYVQLIIDGKIVSNISKSDIDIISVPTCRKLEGTLGVSQIIIIQKQSIFYELVSIFKQFKLYQRYALITARGYPDNNTRSLLFQFSKQQKVKIMHYFGDYDIYGFDIYYFYALGDWNCNGLLQKINLLDLGKQIHTDIFNTKRLNEEMNKFNKDDLKKISQIWKKIDGLMSRINQFQYKIRRKIQRMKQYFSLFEKNQLKCQLELFSECAYTKLWLQKIIQKQVKLQNE